jgi:hypothetical protein
MPDPVAKRVEDVLIHPLAEVLARVGQGVADAQRAMDLNSLATQTLLANDPVLKEYGLEATWYHMPEVNVELKMNLTMRAEDTVKNGKVALRKLRMYAAPFNASYQNTFRADVAGTSQVRARIVSIPPPRHST